MESSSFFYDVFVFRIRRFGRSFIVIIGLDIKIFVVWLENFEDYENFFIGIFLYKLIKILLLVILLKRMLMLLMRVI